MHDPIIFLTVLTAAIQLSTAVAQDQPIVWIDTTIIWFLCANVVLGRMQISRMTERSDA